MKKLEFTHLYAFKVQFLTLNIFLQQNTFHLKRLNNLMKSCFHHNCNQTDYFSII